VIPHEPNRLLSADQLPGADRKIDRAEAVRAAVDQIAEKDEDAPLASPRLARGFVEKRAQQISAAMNVADRENLDVGRKRPRQDERLTIYDSGH
jgi:hypothetical protein